MKLATERNNDVYLEGKLFALKLITEEIHTKREQLRVILCHTYDTRFPTLEETARESKDNPDAGKKKHTKKDSRSDDDEGSSGDSDNDNGYRTWTSRNGRFHVKAKLVGAANGQVILEKPNGQRLPPIDIDKLSDEDQEYVDAQASKGSSHGDDDDSAS